MSSRTQPGERRRRNIGARLALTAGVVLLGLAAIGGVFANFTDTQSAGPEPISSGTVHITLGTPAADHGAVTVGATNMAEGDTVARVVQLTNNTNLSTATGLATTGGLTLGTSVSGLNSTYDIVTDTTNGLHVTVQSCATVPTEAGPPYTYTCSGGFTTVVNNVALGTLDTTPADITSSAPNEGASVYYVVTVTLPTTYADAYSYNAGACSKGGTAGSSEQLMGCSLSVTYNFTATQRAGTSL
jgi:hypothetical protein